MSRRWRTLVPLQRPLFLGGHQGENPSPQHQVPSRGMAQAQDPGGRDPGSCHPWEAEQSSLPAGLEPQPVNEVLATY